MATEMMWMRMPGQSWAGVATSFLGMWTVMMAAMMLPSLVPVLRRHASSVMLSGYFLVWIALGIVVFPLGVALSRAAPIVSGLVVLVAGFVQLSRWKAARLRACRESPADAGSAWRQGLCLGLHCIQSCAGLTAVMLVLGVMDLRVMLLSAGAITLERLAPSRIRVERIIGVGIIATGLFLVTSALS